MLVFYMSADNCVCKLNIDGFYWFYSAPHSSFNRPDRGVPASSVQFIKVLHATMAAQFKCQQEAKAAGEPKVPPCLVHCSAGVGRTGKSSLTTAQRSSMHLLENTDGAPPSVSSR